MSHHKMTEKERATIERRVTAARDAGRAEAERGTAVKIDAAHDLGFIEGSRSTLRTLYQKSDRAMVIYLSNLLGHANFVSADSEVIEARETVLKRANEFESRILFGIKKKKPAAQTSHPDLLP